MLKYFCNCCQAPMEFAKYGTDRMIGMSDRYNVSVLIGEKSRGETKLYRVLLCDECKDRMISTFFKNPENESLI